MGIALATFGSVPPANIAKSPDIAFFTPPETGASIRLMPFLFKAPPSSIVKLGSLEPISIARASGFNLSKNSELPR